MCSLKEKEVGSVKKKKRVRRRFVFRLSRWEMWVTWRSLYAKMHRGGRRIMAVGLCKKCMLFLKTEYGITKPAFFVIKTLMRMYPPIFFRRKLEGHLIRIKPISAKFTAGSMPYFHKKRARLVIKWFLAEVKRQQRLLGGVSFVESFCHVLLEIDGLKADCFLTVEQYLTEGLSLLWRNKGCISKFLHGREGYEIL